MDFEEEQEEELSMPPPSYDDSSLTNTNPSRLKMPTLGQEGDPPSMGLPSGNSGKGRYRECLKNHALAIGGHALDGCCEFMPAGADGTLDALKCAACNCHRNFHRKETTDTAHPGAVADPYTLLPHNPHNNPYHNRHHQQQFPQYAACYRAQGAGYLHVAGQQRGGGGGGGGAPPPGTLALPSISGAGCGTQSTRDEHEDVSEPSGGGGVGGGDGGGGGSSSSKKRFRTKFTQEQKDKMLDFAEKLGWRIQKHDEVAVQEFCQENGVKRNVFKVWMHNNKHTLGKKP